MKKKTWIERHNDPSVSYKEWVLRRQRCTSVKAVGDKGAGEKLTREWYKKQQSNLTKRRDIEKKRR